MNTNKHKYIVTLQKAIVTTWPDYQQHNDRGISFVSFISFCFFKTKHEHKQTNININTTQTQTNKQKVNLFIIWPFLVVFLLSVLLKENSMKKAIKI